MTCGATATEQGRPRRLARTGLLAAALLGFAVVTCVLPRGAEARYDRAAAVAYAARWCDGRNHNYTDYSDSNGDCVNFVSQCLLAGGMNLNDPNLGGHGRGGTYINTTQLNNYLTHGHAHMRWQDRTEMVAGDVLILAHCDSRSRYHAVLIHRVSGNGAHKRIWVDAHTTDRCNEEYAWGSVCGYYYHITDDCDCTAGHTQDDDCGHCGTRTRTCRANCTWGDWGDCRGQGACAKAATQDGDCGNCGKHTRTCRNDCSWGGWGGCTGEGVCAAGSTGDGECGNCGHHGRSCGPDCKWGGWDACAGEGVCAAGAGASEACGDCGQHTRSCGPDCQWPDWGACAGPDPGGGTQVCDTGLPGVCAVGRMRCTVGQLGCAPETTDDVELCDGLDNDCDGEADDGYPAAMGPVPPAYAATRLVATFPPALREGGRAQVEASFRNVGSEVWPAGEIALAPRSLVGQDGAGAPDLLYDPRSWPSPDKAAVLAAAVMPGAIGRFAFSILAPAGLGGETVAETFRLLDPDGQPLRCPQPDFELEVKVDGEGEGAPAELDGGLPPGGDAAIGNDATPGAYDSIRGVAGGCGGCGVTGGGEPAGHGAGWLVVVTLAGLLVRRRR